MSPFEEARFFRAVYDFNELPRDAGAEVAFAGRSNAGKSSAINALVKRHRLAFISKTPGRTQTMNFFSLGAQRYLVDLPGYGYAAVPREEKQRWRKLISTYIQTRVSLRGLVIIMDARHPFGPLDRQLLDWAAPFERPAYVLLTKADKLSDEDAMSALRVAEAAARHYPGCAVQLFSSTAGIGIGVARKTIAQWLT